MTKYESETEEVLHYMAGQSSWADRTGGDSGDGPIGWFGTVTINDYELTDLYPIAEDLFSFEQLRTMSDDLVGHFLIREATDGQVAVQRFTTQEAAWKAFDELWGVLMNLEAVSNEPSI